MSGGMNRTELLAEVRRLHRLLATAARKAAAHHVLIDKLAAAQLRAQHLLKKLGAR